MIGHEVVEKIDELEGDNRGKVLNALIENMSGVSQQTLIEWQNKFVHENPQDFDVFVKEQNKQILEMLKMETSEIGVMVREALKLKPFNMDANYG